MAEQSNLEKALLYATHDGNGGLEVSPTLVREQKAVEYQQLVSSIFDIPRLITIQEALERDLPYLQLCSETNITHYFERFGLPITNFVDLRIFYDAIIERLEEIVQKKGNNFAAYKTPHRSIIFGRAAESLTALEKTISEFEELKDLFEDSLNIVHALAVRYGKDATTAIKTKTKGTNEEITVGTIELKPAALEIKKCPGYITQLRLWNGENTNISPNHEVYLLPKSHEQRIFRRGIPPPFSNIDLMILPVKMNYNGYNHSILTDEISYFSKQFLKTGINYFKLTTIWTCEGFFNTVKNSYFPGSRPDPEFTRFLKLIFNAPRALEQHFKELDQKFQEEIASLTAHLEK